MRKLHTSLWPLQQSIYSRLVSDAALGALITGVFDGEEVEPNAKLPYVTLGEDTVNDYSTKQWIGEDVTVTLHCFSEYRGKKEAKQILDAMLKALSSAPLTVPGYIVEGLEREYLNVIPQEGIYHGVTRIRVHIKPETN